MNARTLNSAEPIAASAEPSGFEDDAAPAGVSVRAVVRMMVKPTSFLARFSRDELDAIVRAGQDVPEISGCGE